MHFNCIACSFFAKLLIILSWWFVVNFTKKWNWSKQQKSQATRSCLWTKQDRLVVFAVAEVSYQSPVAFSISSLCEKHVISVFFASQCKIVYQQSREYSLKLIKYTRKIWVGETAAADFGGIISGRIKWLTWRTTTSSMILLTGNNKYLIALLVPTANAKQQLFAQLWLVVCWYSLVL